MGVAIFFLKHVSRAALTRLFSTMLVASYIPRSCDWTVFVVLILIMKRMMTRQLLRRRRMKLVAITTASCYSVTSDAGLELMSTATVNCRKKSLLLSCTRRKQTTWRTLSSMSDFHLIVIIRIVIIIIPVLSLLKVSTWHSQVVGGKLGKWYLYDHWQLHND